MDNCQLGPWEREREKKILQLLSVQFHINAKKEKKIKTMSERDQRTFTDTAALGWLKSRSEPRELVHKRGGFIFEDQCVCVRWRDFHAHTHTHTHTLTHTCHAKTLDDGGSVCVCL